MIEKNEGQVARIFTLANGDRVVAVKDGRNRQPTSEDLETHPSPHNSYYTPPQSPALWPLRRLKALCAGDPEDVRRALVGEGGAS